jgi:Golgi nucleoside diphosphatase
MMSSPLSRFKIVVLPPLSSPLRMSPDAMISWCDGKIKNTGIKENGTTGKEFAFLSPSVCSCGLSSKGPYRCVCTTVRSAAGSVSREQDNDRLTSCG